MSNPTSDTPPKKREIVRKAMLSMLPKGGVAAEIGVSAGDFSVQIVDITKPSRLFLIDPWDLLAGTQSVGSGSEWFNKKSAMQETFYKVCDRFQDAPQIVVCRGFSTVVLDGYTDGHFDWMYLDGSHYYDDVKADLKLALSKTKVGGVVAGDDFFWSRDDRQHVKDAVRDTITELGLDWKINVLDLENPPASYRELTGISRLGQQFFVPVTAEIKQALQGKE